MVENTLYLATEEVAKRAGVYEVAYVTRDRRFILDSMEVRRIRMTGEEYISGISGLEPVSREEAQALIAENGYRRIGDMDDEEPEAGVTSVESQEETPEENAGDAPGEGPEESDEEPAGGDAGGAGDNEEGKGQEE